MYIIITNNPDVVTKYPKITRYYEIDVPGVFRAVRDAVHGHAKLITYPLSGSIKPNISPYKSVIISTPGDSLDFESLRVIEDAFDVLNRLKKTRHDYSGETLLDFRVIDLDFIDSSIDSPAQSGAQGVQNKSKTGICSGTGWELVPKPGTNSADSPFAAESD